MTKENKKQEKKEEKLTEHFSLEELTRTDETDLKELNLQEGRAIKEKLTKLAEFAESVRGVLGCPMVITSGFRCEKLNAKLGGSPTSQHRFCEAIDFIPKKLDAETAFARIILSGIDYGQLIYYTRGISHFLHISMGAKRQNLKSDEVGKYVKL